MKRSPKPDDNAGTDPHAKPNTASGAPPVTRWRSGASVVVLGTVAAVLVSGCASGDGGSGSNTARPASASAAPSGPAVSSPPAAPPNAAEAPGSATPATPPPPGETMTTTPPRGTPQDDRALLDASRKGDAAGVRAALERGANIEARDGDRRTPLLLAAIEDHVEAARILVAAGADPDARDYRDDTAWLVTGVTGSVEMARTLLPADPDPTLRNRYGGTSLIPASERGHVEYERFVTAGTRIDVDHVNNLGWTALLEAVILGDGGPDHQEVVRILLAAGADPRIADKGGVTPLRHAQERGYRVIADILRAAP